VLERRCPKCRAFTEQRKKTKQLLRGLIDLVKGDSIESVVAKLGEQVTNLRKENKEFTERHITDRDSILQLREAAKLWIGDEVGEIPTLELAVLAKRAFHDIQTAHKQALVEQRAELDQEKQGLLAKVLRRLSTRDLGDEIPTSPSDLVDAVLARSDELRREMRQAEIEVHFANDLLKKVEAWMNRLSECDTHALPIDQALIIMMDQIEHKPNPLKAELLRMRADVSIINDDLEVVESKLEKLLSIEPNSMLKRGRDIFRILGSVSAFMDKHVEKFHELAMIRQNFEQELQAARLTLVSVAVGANRILERPGYPYEELTLQALLLQVDILCQEMFTPGRNKRFISIVDLNNMTMDMRKGTKLETVLNPSVYLPKLSKRWSTLCKGMNLISEFADPLETIFKTCDFRAESFDSTSPIFLGVREQVFRMHGIIGRMPEAKLKHVIVSVLKLFVSLASSFISCLASVSFQSLSQRNRAAAMKGVQVEEFKKGVRRWPRRL
jgi:hypothetical protein